MKSSLAVLGAAFSLLLGTQVAVAASTGTPHRAPVQHGSTAASAVAHRPAHAVAHPKKKKHRVKKTAHPQKATGHGQAGQHAPVKAAAAHHVKPKARHAKTSSQHHLAAGHHHPQSRHASAASPAVKSHHPEKAKKATVAQRRHPAAPKVARTRIHHKRTPAHA